MRAPLVWEFPNLPNYRHSNAESPEGRFEIASPRTYDGHTDPVRFKFIPPVPDGLDRWKDYMILTERRKALEAEGASYEDPEFAYLTASMGHAYELGYFHTPEHGHALIEYARQQTEPFPPVFEQLVVAGYTLRHPIDRGSRPKLYVWDRTVRTGHLDITWGEGYVHATFTFRRSHSWVNVFSYHRDYIEGHDGNKLPVFLPDYMDSMEVGVAMAIQANQLFEDDGGAIRPKRTRKKAKTEEA